MSSRWTEVTESAHAGEQEALGYIRERLPDQEPFRAWSNFELIADDGSMNEVDLLVLSVYKIFLVEIKSRPGRVSGDAGVWTWENSGRLFTDDNPLLLTNRKAKKLKSLLGRQAAFHKQRVPYIQPLVFLSAPGLRCDLQGLARQGVYLREENVPSGEPGIIAILTGEQGAAGLWDDKRSPRLDRRQVQALGRALEPAGMDWVWELGEAGGRGAYHPRSQTLGTSSQSSTSTHAATLSHPHRVAPPFVASGVRHSFCASTPSALNTMRDALHQEYDAAREAGRTGEAFETWHDGVLTQASVAWLLGGGFVRFLEDNGLIPEPLLSGPVSRRQQALKRHTRYFQQHPTDNDRDYLYDVFGVAQTLPAMAPLFDTAHNPVWAKRTTSSKFIF